MLTPPAVLTSLAVTVVLAAGGAGGTWWLRRHSTLSIRNVYPIAAISLLLFLAAVLLGVWPALPVLVPLGAPWIVASAIGRRWRLSDLGAGEELRRHELDRRWLWQPAPELPRRRTAVDRPAKPDHPPAPLARARRVRVDDHRRGRRRPTPARRGPPRVRLRRHRRRQDHQRPATARRADPRPRRRRAADRPEGRPRR